MLLLATQLGTIIIIVNTATSIHLSVLKSSYHYLISIACTLVTFGPSKLSFYVPLTKNRQIAKYCLIDEHYDVEQP